MTRFPRKFGREPQMRHFQFFPDARARAAPRNGTRAPTHAGVTIMMIYLAFAAVITMVLAAGVCFGVVIYALETQYNEFAHEVSRLGYRALAELETARTDILRLGEKLDASSAPEPASSHYPSE
jgi:hypothetical protein